MGVEDREMTTRESNRTNAKREPEYCDDCGACVGYYDDTLPEGEKIVITNPCRCWEPEATKEA